MEVVPDKMDVKHMDATFRSVFMDVSPCVVIVEQIGRIDKFCVGSVISSEKDEGTFILTQAEITSPSANLAVRFFDGIKLPVTPLLTIGFVIDDMEYAYCPSRADKDYIAYHGTELKVVESSSIVQADLSTALGGDDGENCLLTQHKILNKSND
ncbi:hypothetical protein PR202_gb03684 [Eleusine coracana subsp. coracana]|uniref:Uncharacterized protein n=1 Tax=Eleusine coracana subsp. coracana TaxID=191504 RepID=A0AAV5E1U0_ELECO|nr:hypothetical protein PR202_gb03684 [Eleusine coracana subsp. coracana]